MNNDVDEVKRRINLVDLVQSYVPLKKAGASWRGLCPFHQEKTPSFHVNHERQIFKCFGCGEAGDALDWMIKMEHLTFPEALQMLADRVGVIIDHAKTPIQYAKEKDEKSRLYKINRLAAEVYAKILRDHPRADSARAYLGERGIGKDTIAKFKLGYAPPVSRGAPTVLGRFLNERGFTASELRLAGNPERFSNRIIFPLYDVLGNPVGFTGRALDKNDQPKYLNTPETPIFKKGRILYPLHQAKDAIKASNRVILVEGQTDVLLAHQLGTEETVAASGTALTAEHLSILGRYTPKILLSFDTDLAGIEATRKAILLAYDLELDPSVVTLPDGYKDLGELALAKPMLWGEALTQSKPALMWQLETAYGSVTDPNSGSGKKEVGKLVLPVLARIQDPLERAHWSQIMAKKLSIPERTVSEALERYLNKSKDKTTDAKSETRQSSQPVEQLSAEEILLGLLLLHPKQLSRVAEKLNPDDFLSLRGKELAKTIAVCYTLNDKTREEVSILDVKMRLDLELRKWLDILLAEVAELHPMSDEMEIAEEIRSGFTRLSNIKHDQFKENTATKIAEAEARGDRAEVKKLLKDLQSILK